MRDAVGLARRKHRDNVGLLERGREQDLAREALRGDFGRELRAQHLDDDAPAQRALGGHEDPRHATASQLALDRVAGTEIRLEVSPEVRHPEWRMYGSRNGPGRLRA